MSVVTPYKTEARCPRYWRVCWSREVKFKEVFAVSCSGASAPTLRRGGRYPRVQRFGTDRRYLCAVAPSSDAPSDARRFTTASLIAATCISRTICCGDRKSDGGVGRANGDFRGDLGGLRPSEKSIVPIACKWRSSVIFGSAIARDG